MKTSLIRYHAGCCIVDALVDVLVDDMISVPLRFSHLIVVLILTWLFYLLLFFFLIPHPLFFLRRKEKPPKKLHPSPVVGKGTNQETIKNN